MWEEKIKLLRIQENDIKKKIRKNQTYINLQYSTIENPINACIEGIIFVQSTEMEEKFSAFIYKNNVIK